MNDKQERKSEHDVEEHKTGRGDSEGSINHRDDLSWEELIKLGKQFLGLPEDAEPGDVRKQGGDVIGPNDIHQQVTRIEDLDQLKALSQGIVGQKCWEVSTRFDWILGLDLGEKRPVSHRLTNMMMGTWVLEIHTSEWHIEDSEGNIYCSPADAPQNLKALVQVLDSATIISFEIGYPSLGVDAVFDNGYRLVLTTCEDFEVGDEATQDAERDPRFAEYYVEPRCWELFTPHHMILKIGPGGRKWSYTRSDVPI